MITRKITYKYRCPQGLNRKVGEIPTRSRHCNGEQIQEMPLERSVLGRFGGAMILSQKNCLLYNHRVARVAQYPTSDGEGDFVMAYSHIMRASSLYYFYKAGFFMRKYYAFFESVSSSRGRFFSVGKQWTACKKME